MNFKKLSRYYHTVKHLKTKQIAYGIYYRLRDKIWPIKFKETVIPPGRNTLNFIEFPSFGSGYFAPATFQFLNQRYAFTDKIDWNYSGYGKLWTYNLNYFDFLHQPVMTKEIGLRLIRDFIDQQHAVSDGMEPYPISLRGINWIKFLSKYHVVDHKIDRSLYNQYQLLTKMPEYHLMGNHLLENGMSLLVGGLYFDDSVFLDRAKAILFNQLEEQILSDGAHFERSPMYHLILLNRLLDCFNLLSQNKLSNQKTTGLEALLKQKISSMLDWLNYIRFSSYDLPSFNDSTNIPPIDPRDIINYGKSLNFQIIDKSNKGITGESGYRMIKQPDYELCIDAGKPGPDYIPGHVHCDIFSFILYATGKPVIVDPGLSNYEEGEVRNFERSTAAHNTVAIEGLEQSDIWKSFRVGRRAEVTTQQEDKRTLIASHNGFWDYGFIHQRIFTWSDLEILIEDTLKGKSGQETEAFLYIHLHPDRKAQVMNNNEIKIDDLVKVQFEHSGKPEIHRYNYAYEFNHRELANCIRVPFTYKMKTLIEVIGS